ARAPGAGRDRRRGPLSRLPGGGWPERREYAASTLGTRGGYLMKARGFWAHGKLAAAVVAAAVAQPALGQAIEAKTIRFIVGFPPGGAVDLIARAVAPGIGEAVGRSVVVDNRAGASGAIGAELLVKSPADGSAIGLVSISSMVLNV